jgi:hypothetical protein
MKISTEVYVTSSLKLMHPGKQVVLDNSENVSDQGTFEFVCIIGKIFSKLCGNAQNPDRIEDQ